jgi:predicted DNA-binding mobile mystery protein A
MRSEVRQRARTELDERLAALKPEDRFRAPPKGWIRALRDVLGMSSAQLGKRLGKRAQSVDDWEEAEANGSIQLKTLRQAADALECRLVYALVPKTSLNATVDTRTRKIAMRDLKRVAHTMKLEAQGTDDGDLEARIENYIRDNLKERDIWNEP